MTPLLRNSGVAVYLHVPYCAALCHYCDFAKTARFDASSTTRYFEQLGIHLAAWLVAYERLRPGFGIHSVFFGGGTPSLVVDEVEQMMALVRERLMPHAEITLEANPEHCDSQRLRGWRQAGVNRLSLGIQSFQPEGLNFLTRTHSPATALRAIAEVQLFMPSVSGDLIYGWPGQSQVLWEDDVATMMNAGVHHMSCYGLTYEKSTPIGRRKDRGILAPVDEGDESEMYAATDRILTQNGFQHYEVSNFARLGHASTHNQSYWEFRDWLAVGVGAHAYIGGAGSWGTRFSYPRQERAFLAMPPPAEVLFVCDDSNGRLLEMGLGIDERSAIGWILERASCGLRTTAGCNVKELGVEVGGQFNPSPAIREGVKRKLVSLSPEGVLTLTVGEWFREHAWSLEVSKSFGSTAGE